MCILRVPLLDFTPRGLLWSVRHLRRGFSSDAPHFDDLGGVAGPLLCVPLLYCRRSVLRTVRLASFDSLLCTMTLEML